jgi:hypothetical protein
MAVTLGVGVGGSQVSAATYSAPLATAITDLPVQAETPAGYDRDLFPHWVDGDGDGQDTRAERLFGI